MITIPNHINRQFVIDHPQWIFVYSCDTIGRACNGIMWNCHGEPNAFGIPTLIKFCSAKQFFYDCEAHEVIVLAAISRIPLDGRPIIVIPKIGRGCSRMFELAPKLFKTMWDELDKIREKNVYIDSRDPYAMQGLYSGRYSPPRPASDSGSSIIDEPMSGKTKDTAANISNADRDALIKLRQLQGQFGGNINVQSMIKRPTVK
jgi:hypothetical protein